MKFCEFCNGILTSENENVVRTTKTRTYVHICNECKKESFIENKDTLVNYLVYESIDLGIGLEEVLSTKFDSDSLDEIKSTLGIELSDLISSSRAILRVRGMSNSIKFDVLNDFYDFKEGKVYNTSFEKIKIKILDIKNSSIVRGAIFCELIYFISEKRTTSSQKYVSYDEIKALGLREVV